LCGMLYQLKYFSHQFGGKLTKNKIWVHLSCLYATYIELYWISCILMSQS
jgi:hypothetical protein